MKTHARAPFSLSIPILALVCVAVALTASSSLWPRASEHESGEERGADEPLEAMRWVVMAQRDESGNIAPNGLMIAKSQMDAMRARQRRAPGADAAFESIAGINQSAWTWIGPGNIGGRTRAISINPDNPSDIVIGGVAGGIWRTFNAGGTWNPINDFMANLAVVTIVRKPGDSSTLLAGTGEGFFNFDAIRGAGVFRSTDSGASWTQLGSTLGSEFHYVMQLAFSPDGTTVLAATRNGVYRSTNTGDSWTQVLAVTDMTDVEFLPGNNTRAVASGFRKRGYYSTNGGLGWTLSVGLDGTGATFNRVELGVSVSSPMTVYASYAAGGTSSSTPAEMWRSTDGGVVYTLLSTPNHLSAQGWYDNTVWVDPTDVNHVVIGGVSRYRSTNGTTFAGQGGSVHSDHHIFVSEPGYNGSSNRRVYYGNDGGIYRLEDSWGTTFTRLNNNYGVTQFYGGAAQNATGKIFGGTQDHGTLVYTPAGGPQSWTTMAGGDGGYATADQTNNNYLYGEYQWLGVHRSTNGGASSSSITGCGGAAPLSDSCNQTTNFIAPILLDPNEPNRLLAGGRSLWRNDAARTSSLWSAIKPPNPGNSNISAVAVAVGNPDLVWIGHNNGDVYKTTNGTDGAPTWIKVDDAGPLPGRTATSIAIDPANSDVVYVSFGGFSAGNVWKTTNAGASWADAAGGAPNRLPSVPVRTVVAHPTVAGWIYAGTDVGVFASEDGGSTWQVPHDGPANVAVFQLFFMNSTLVAVTHGRGMFTAAATSQPPVITQHPVNRTVGVGANTSFTAAATGVPSPTWQWQRWNGAAWQNVIDGAPYSGATTPTLTITGAAPALSGSQFRAMATNTGGSAATNAALLTVYGAGVNLLQNGDFGGGMTGWQVFEEPDIVWNVFNGMFLFFRQSPPVTASRQAVVYQHTGVPLGAGVPLTAQFDLGNNSTARKRITVLILDSNFSDLHTCTFFLGPNAPMRTYQMKTHSNQSWANTAIYFYAASNGSTGHHYMLDNVSMAYDPAASTTRTDCVDPTAPTPPGGSPSGNLLGNPDFGTGTLGPWGVFGNITWQIAGGTFEFHQPTAATPAAVLLQGVGPVAAGQTLTASFQLGNSSAQRRRLSVLLHDADFTDVTACTFWLPAATALDTYTMRVFTTKAWSNAMLSIYSATVGAVPWARVDNASLQTTPATAALGTECIEPVPPAPPPGGSGGPSVRR